MKALYILQITKEKLTHESFKTLKALLNYILKHDTLVKDITIEVYFEEKDFGNNFTDHCKSVV